MSAAEQTIASLRRGGTQILIVDAVMVAVAAVSVALRFMAKIRRRAPLGMDDLLICLSLAVFVAVEGLMLRAVIVGRKAENPTDADFSTFLFLTYIFSLLYWSVIAPATSSVLFLYRRVFSASPRFRIASAVVAALTGCWWISGTLGDALAYQPAEAYWNSSIGGDYTINYNSFWLANMVLEMVLESAALVLPIREVARLSLSRGRKLLVIGLFLMGGLILVTAVVRVYYAWAQEDMTPGCIWLTVHCAAAIVSASLPTYRALFRSDEGDAIELRRSASGPIISNLGPNQSVLLSPPPAHLMSDPRRIFARKSVESTLSNEALTALPAMHTHVVGRRRPPRAFGRLRSADSHQPTRRALFAEVDRGLKQLEGRPESGFLGSRAK